MIVVCHVYVSVALGGSFDDLQSYDFHKFNILMSGPNFVFFSEKLKSSR